MVNTSWGLLLTLANREETEGGWITLKQTHWRLMPVLDVNRLSKTKLQRLTKIFEEFCTKELPRIPQQYGANGSANKIRVKLDLSVLNALGIKAGSKDLDSFYQSISSSLSQWLGV